MLKVKLQGADGRIFKVDYEVARKFAPIEAVLHTHDLQTPIFVGKMSSRVLKRVIRWARYHLDDELVELSEEHRFTELCPRDAAFLNVNPSKLFELLIAASYFEMQDLILTTSKAIANKIAAQTVEQIRETFEIENDFTANEERRVQEKNAWCGGLPVLDMEQ